MDVSQSLLKELLDYSEDSGVFLFKRTRGGIKKGSVAGTNLKSGDSFYVRISICGRQYLAHRLAWMYVYGEFPDCEIDHIDGDCSNNRISNLRLASRKQNNENTRLRTNNSSGYRGVSFRKDTGKWRAQMQHNKKIIDFGYFDTPEEASAAAEKKRREVFTHYTGRELNG